MEQNTTIQMRISEELKKSIAEEAKKDGRSVSNFIKKVLADYLKSNRR